MNTISANKLRCVLAQMKRTLVGNRRSSDLWVQFRGDRDRLTTVAKSKDVVVGCELAGCFEPFRFRMMLDEAVEFFKRQSGPISLKVIDNTVSIDARDSAGTFVTVNECSTSDLDTDPVILQSNSTRLASALLFAAKTTDPDSARYSIGCIQFQSEHGRIVATNGRQAFVETDLALPAGDWFVPAEAVRRFSPLDRASSISVGIAEDQFMTSLASDQLRWRLAIRVQKPRQFPDIAPVVSATTNPRTTLRIDDDDAKSLIDALQELVTERGAPRRVTVDLSRRLVVHLGAVKHSLRQSHESPERANGSDFGSTEARPNESRGVEVTDVHSIELRRSNLTGRFVRFSIDPRVLIAALEFGFRELNTRGCSFPISFNAGRSQFICAVEFAEISAIVASSPSQLRSRLKNAV